MTRLRVAVVGIGKRGGWFCQNIIEKNADKADLVAMVDVHPHYAQIIADHYDLSVQISDDYEEVVTRDDVDAVVVVTPDFAHVGPTTAALKAGKHVFIEKPLAIKLEDCDRMIEASRQSDAICCVGFNLRHGPVHGKVHDLIQQGKLGKITTIESNEWYFGGRTYFRRWNRLCKFGGGLWITKASHDFDMITWLAGGPPTRVCAMANLSHYKPLDGAGPRCRDCGIKDSCPDFYDVKQTTDYWFPDAYNQHQLELEETNQALPLDLCLYNSDKDTFDNGVAIIEYDNDVRATYTVNVVASTSTRQLGINGTKGAVEADMTAGIVEFTERFTEKKTTFDMYKETVGGHGGADNTLLSEFFDKCTNGGVPRSGLEDGRLSLRLGLAARTSCDENRIVQL